MVAHISLSFSALPRRVVFAVIITSLLFANGRAFGQVPCDLDKSCLGNALNLIVTSGVKQDYIEIESSALQSRFTTSLTVEMWANITRESGKRQFIGGLWGPSNDDNDQWVLYVSESDQLVFEVSPNGTKLKSNDNTIARTDARPIYGTWTHITAVFNGASSSCSLYINGVLANTGTNPSYQCRTLRPTERANLYVQFGGINGVSDDISNYRTLKGQLDEVRMWNRVLSANEIYCNQYKSLAGSEGGLVVYFRFNQGGGAVQMCDATGNSFFATTRNSASCQAQNPRRRLPKTLTISPPLTNGDFVDTVRCASTKTYTFTIIDTSVCGNSVTITKGGVDAGLFTVTPASMTLTQNVPQTITAIFNGSVVGAIDASITLNAAERCAVDTTIDLKVTRMAELEILPRTVQFDTIFYGNLSVQFIDSTVVLRNNSAILGQPRPLTVSSITTSNPAVFQIVSPTPAQFPLPIPAGASQNVIVRFLRQDTTRTWTATMTVNSDDRCGSGKTDATLVGSTQEVLRFNNTGNQNVRYNGYAFGTECVGQATNGAQFAINNKCSRPVVIYRVSAPPGTEFILSLPTPATIQPNAAYNRFPFFQYRPRTPGFKRDTFTIHYRMARKPGSTDSLFFEKKMVVTGTGLRAIVSWSVPSAAFGNCIVGQATQLTVQLTNRDTARALNCSIYPIVGEVFQGSLTNVNLAPLQTTSITLTFRPLKDTCYNDILLLVGVVGGNCYSYDSLPISGCGVYNAFKYTPELLRIKNVIACGSKFEHFEIRNLTSQPQEMTNVALVDPPLPAPPTKFRFTFVDASDNPRPLQSNYIIPPNDKLDFYLRYTPADVTQDRADRVFLDYKDKATNKDWRMQILGLSATPKLFVTELTVFGNLEVGDTKRDSVIVENISPMPVDVDSMNIGRGYTIDSVLHHGILIPTPSITNPFTLQPRDSLKVLVTFRPDTNIRFFTQVKAYANKTPCPGVVTSGELRGTGIIIPLDAPLNVMNFGFVESCRCEIRDAVLQNQSLTQPMSIDSIWIDGQNVVGATPQFFNWASTYSPSGVVPYEIPPKMGDTLKVKFCPNSPAQLQFLNSQARLHIRAHGNGWSRPDADNPEYNIYLGGKRMFTFTPSDTAPQFPPTRVDINGPTRQVELQIPGVGTNPAQAPLTLDSITFQPDERVFTASESTGRAFPMLINSSRRTIINVDFKPRAPKIYKARMVLHFSRPCAEADTTVLVTGTGFAPAYGLRFEFSKVIAVEDTFRMNTCDTLEIPLYTSREVPANLFDVKCRLGYDTTELRYIGGRSPNQDETLCPQYPASRYARTITARPDLVNQGTYLNIKNLCSVDSTSAFFYARFVSNSQNRSNTLVTIDSIDFDTEESILYRIVAGNDLGRVIVLKADYRISNPLVVFDSVRILDCADRTITVVNTGDVPIALDTLLKLPNDVVILSSSIPLHQVFNVGDSVTVTLRYCPSRPDTLSEWFNTLSLKPCGIIDSAQVTGTGYAPEITMGAFAQTVRNSPDTTLFQGQIRDTIEVAVNLDKDVSATYNGKVHWLNGTSFDIGVTYNKHQLRYLSAVSAIDPSMVPTIKNGDIQLSYTNRDTLKAGEIARLKFQLVVPDVFLDTLTVITKNFTVHQDSLEFLVLKGDTAKARVQVDARCTISYVKYNVSSPKLFEPEPNPAQSMVQIRYELQETAPLSLELTDSQGKLVQTLVHSASDVPAGKYIAEFDVSPLQNGVYFYTVRSGVFSSTKKLVISR